MNILIILLKSIIVNILWEIDFFFLYQYVRSFSRIENVM